MTTTETDKLLAKKKNQVMIGIWSERHTVCIEPTYETTRDAGDDDKQQRETVIIYMNIRRTALGRVNNTDWQWHVVVWTTLNPYSTCRRASAIQCRS